MKNNPQFHAKNLSGFPIPSIIENIPYEDLLKENINRLNGVIPLTFDPNFQPLLVQAEIIETENGFEFRIPVDDHAGMYYTALESEPLLRLLQVDTYRMKTWLNYINNMTLAMMPAYCEGSVLDHYAVSDGVNRLLMTAEDKTTSPPTAAVYEADDSFRRRWLLSKEARSNGGSEGWYLFHALSADPRIKDALAFSPNPRGVLIVILSTEGNGTASQELIDKVHATIKEKYTEVMTDELVVQSAKINEYRIEAEVWYYLGSSNETVNKNIEEKYADYRARTEQIGHIIDDSNIYDFLRQEGIYRAEIKTPDLPIHNNQFQASFCTGLTLKSRGEHGSL